MMLSSLIVAACMGQICSPPVIAPPLYVEYCLGPMSERTREYKRVPYRDGTTRTVPVINGYVPRYIHTRYANGVERIIYDYRIGETYADAMAKWRARWESEAKPLIPPEQELPKKKHVIPKKVPKSKPVIPKVIISEPPPPQPKTEHLTPVVPDEEEPAVTIPPSYRED